MNPAIKRRLSLMMFLQFFVWGAWFVTMGTYLGHVGFTGGLIGYSYLMNNIGAIIAPFFIGMVADRFFASERVMAVLHLAGGLVMYYAAGVTDVGILILLLLLYNSCYMPTLALVNAISFYQMENPEKQFPAIRVWGTIGWIIAGLLITFIQVQFFEDVEKSSIPFKMAGIASLLLGVYSLTLPHTPPKNVGQNVTFGEIMGLKALRLLKSRSFLVFTFSSLLISIPLAFYYSFTNLFLNEIGMTAVAAKQTMGQMSEIVFMLLMPWFFVRLGVKKMLLLGMLAWVIRYGLFAMGDLGPMIWMLYLGILLHGICYDFFFVTGQIYVDKKAGEEIRASAQGFMTLITYGFGLGIGSVISGQVVDAFTVEEVRSWSIIWWVPALFALSVVVLFALTFKDKVDKAGSTEGSSRPRAEPTGANI